MEYILPKKIEQGATIGIVALSGAIESKESVLQGVTKLKELGFNIKLSEHLFDKKRYLAGEDAIRAAELEKFFSDPEIDCILCARGGYGAIRIIDKINYDVIKSNPKAFCGYSDTTAFSVMMLKHAGLITYSSPMLVGDFGVENSSKYTLYNFIKGINGDKLEFKVSGNETNSADGIIWGGNLTTLASLCGRDFLPDEKFILFIEDINEPVYKIDRALAQLSALPQFCKNINGIVTGDFSGVNNILDLQEVLEEYTNELNCPLWQGLKWGHEREKVTLPIGKICQINHNVITIN